MIEQVNAALSSYRERMVREDEQPNVSSHMFIKFRKFLNNSL